VLHSPVQLPCHAGVQGICGNFRSRVGLLLSRSNRIWRSVVYVLTALRAGHSVVRIPVRVKISLLQNDQSSTGAQPTSYLMGTRGFPGGKAAGSPVNHSPPPSAEVKCEWNSTSAPPIYKYLQSVDRQKFTFTFFCRFALGCWWFRRLGFT
jgi:hypothetical protein